jgi:hypothetical protein
LNDLPTVLEAFPDGYIAWDEGYSISIWGWYREVGPLPFEREAGLADEALQEGKGGEEENVRVHVRLRRGKQESQWEWESIMVEGD